jgi:hypothetical protein
MTEQDRFIERYNGEFRHRQVLADNALLQAKNTKLENELKQYQARIS